MDSAPQRRSQRLQSRQQGIPITTSQKNPKGKGKKRAISEDLSSSGDEQPRQKRSPLPIAPLDPRQDPPSHETAPAKVSQPISRLVNPTLVNSWRINPSLGMCFIFDAISPARLFARGIPFDEDADFPPFSSVTPGDITETDTGLMQLGPRKCRYVTNIALSRSPQALTYDPKLEL